ncbi:universal stress protein [Spectribacter hydrogenoxidans]|uniref:Universal stress protein n=1 Tax=Spectribacter hydrogenoxidans TaxID=3075608 RepID=A0ABU3BZV2_9GAMM|nr:universal stress protein [Salinisphaera sp. W335]MDT0634824.1 universal stress protein [Salinisphaera sp. W335]
MREFERILLAYDGSERGRVALRGAQPLLKLPKSEVHLLAVVPLASAVAAAEGFYTEAMYEAERDRVEQILAEGVEILRELGVEARGHLRAGLPAQEIAELAESLEIDLVVVGHQQRGPLTRWWQGSVSASLLDRLTCAMLVVQACDPALSEDGTP